MEIMLVDDDLTEITIFTEIIHTRGHEYHLSVFQNGIEAYNYLFRSDSYKATKIPDILILKNKIPGKTGFEIITQLRLSHAFDNIITVIISDKHSHAEKSFAQMMRVDGYFIRTDDSFEYLELIERIFELSGKLYRKH